MPAFCRRGCEEGYGKELSHGSASLRRCGLRQDRGGPAGGLQSGGGRNAGGSSCPHHHSLYAALPHHFIQNARLSGQCGHGLPFPHQEGDRRVSAKAAQGRNRYYCGHPSAFIQGCGIQKVGASDRGRGTAVRSDAQGEAERACQKCGCSDAVRHPHTANPEYGCFGYPGYVDSG